MVQALRHARSLPRHPFGSSGILGHRVMAVLTVVGLVLAPLALVAGLAVSTAPPAAAATVSIGAVQARLANHAPATSGNCITYDPSSGSGSSSTSSAWVGASGEALTAHGYSGNSCPSTLSTSTQSALGFKPTSATSAQTGTTFLLGRLAHYNNPVSSTDSQFTGNFVVRLAGSDLTFPWAMWETSNSQSTCPYPAWWLGNSNCLDQTTFTSQIGDQVITIDGISYRLVVQGVTNNGTTTTCAATPAGSYVNEFLTNERAVNYGCLYAQLSQIRTLTVVKDANYTVGAPSSVPAFSYSATSTLAGSPWSSKSFTLAPSIATNASTSAQLLAGSETVTISEGAPATNWALTALSCVDGVGAAVTGVTYNLATRSVTLANVPEATTSAAAPITCTFTNDYTSRATLSLVKSVTGGGPGAPSDWTLTATRSGTPAGQVSGAGGSAAVTSQSVVTGTWTLAETPTGSSSAGYLQQGTWVCVNVATGAAVTVTNGAVTLTDGANVRCTVVNRYLTGTFQISKTISGQTAGFTGTAATAFTGSYACSNGATGTFSVSTGTRWTSPSLPAGISCTVTETQPTGNLADGSYRWGTPAVSYPTGSSVTIADGGSPVVEIANPIVRDVGTLLITKTVTPRTGVPAGGYTGGSTRTFPVTYTCRIGGAVVATDTVQVTTGAAVSVQAIPASAVCTLVETVSTQSGDFADASYAWDGVSYTASAAVPANGSATATVTNAFRRDLASLVLAKTVVGNGYTGGSAAAFSVSYDCGAPYAGTVTLANGGTRTVEVPANVTCRVTEAAPTGNLQPAYVWGAPTYSGLDAAGEVVVPAGQSRTVTVSNPTMAVFGTVSVTKALDGETAGASSTATFDVTVTCSNGFTTTTELSVGEVWTSDPLPVGTRCSATEATPSGGLVDDSYAWGEVTISDAVTVAREVNRALTVTNEIVRAYGSLDITKVVAGIDGVTGAGVTFSGTWECSYGSGAGAVTVSGTWSRTGAGDAALTGPADAVLLGSVCRVTEDTPADAPSEADASYVWGAPQIGAAVTLTAASPDGEIEVRNVISRLLGGFGVSKTVTGDTADAPGHDPDEAFTVGYVCTPATGPTLRGSLQVLPDGSVVAGPADVPAGSACVVTEDAAAIPAPIDPYRWVDVVADVAGATGSQDGYTVRFTMPDDGAVTVAFTNVLAPQSAAVTVTKTVTGETGGYTAGTEPIFTITLVCGDVSHGPLMVADGGSATFEQIPLGQRCRAEESLPVAGLSDASYAWATPTISGPVTVEDGGATIGVENPIVRVYAGFALTKIVDDGGYPGVLASDRSYEGTWSCRYGDDAPVTGTWSVDGAGAATLVGGGADGTRLLVGSVCTATEDDPGLPSTDPSYSWDGDPLIADADVTLDGAAVVTVTNTLRRDVADLTIAKTVTGETAGLDGDTFDIAYSCRVDGVDAVRSGEVAVVAGDDPVTLAQDIPLGWTCEITEAERPALVDASFAWGDPIIEIDGETTTSVTLEDADASYAVVVENPVTRVLGSLTIEKMLDGSTPDGVVATDAVFTGAFTCVYGEGTEREAVYDGTWSVTGTGVATLTGATAIPVTSVCSATEDSPSDGDLADDSWTWGAPVVSDDATVAAADVPAALVVTNAVERVYGGLTVTKEYLGEPGAFADDLTVTGAWACYVEGELVPGGSGTWALPAGGGSVDVVTTEDAVLPATASCVVTEDTLVDADLTDGSWSWLDPTFAPQGATALQAAVAIDPDTQVEASIGNDTERVYADLSVTKQVTGDAIGATGYDPDVTFTGTYSCSYGSDDPVTGSWGPVRAGETIALGAVAYVGSACTLTEDAPGGPAVPSDASFVWLSPEYDPASVTLVAGETAALGVENPTQRLLGSFAVQKAQIVGASDVAPTGGYDFGYTCTALNGDVIEGELTGLDAGGAAAEVTGVPGGSTCVVTEGALPEVDGPFRWAEPMFAASGVGENGATAVDRGIEIVLPRSQSAPVLVTATNELLPAAQVEKTFDGATQHLVDGEWDGTWDLAYTIAVTNPSTATGLDYSLTDTPDYGDAVINGGSATSSVIGTVEWSDPDEPFVLVPDDAPVSLAAGGTDTYAVVINVTAQPTGTGTIAECEAGDGGLSNTAQALTGTETDSDEACAEIPGDPAVTVAKTVVGTPAQGADGRWTITYEIVVSNADPDLATRYDLDDELRFGDGIVIESAAVSGPGARDGWNGVDDLSVAQDRPLAAGADATYEVVVVAAVTARASTDARNCVLSEGESGTGFLNEAAVTTAAGDSSAQACDVPVSPTITKTFLEGSGVPVVELGQAWDGEWALEYEVTVSNPSETTALTYALADRMSEATGEVLEVEVSGGQLTEPVRWEGAVGDIVAADEPVELGAGASDVYRVRVVIRSDAGADPVACDDGQGGVVNTAAATSGSDIVTDTGCGELPGLPTLSLVKIALDKGGRDVSDTFADRWRLTATSADDAQEPLAGDGGAQGLVVPGEYVLSEAAVTGFDDEAWTAGDWVCVDAEGTAISVAAGSVQVALGDDVTCTVTNTEGVIPSVDPATSERPPTPTPTATTPSLPGTGADVGGLTAAAIALLVAGLGAVLVVRRRRAI